MPVIRVLSWGSCGRGSRIGAGRGGGVAGGGGGGMPAPHLTSTRADCNFLQNLSGIRLSSCRTKTFENHKVSLMAA